MADLLQFRYTLGATDWGGVRQRMRAWIAHAPQGNTWELRRLLDGFPFAQGARSDRAGCARGSWNNDERNLRAANRARNEPDNMNENIGFRCGVEQQLRPGSGVADSETRSGRALLHTGCVSAADPPLRDFAVRTVERAVQGRSELGQLALEPMAIGVGQTMHYRQELPGESIGSLGLRRVLLGGISIRVRAEQIEAALERSVYDHDEIPIRFRPQTFQSDGIRGMTHRTRSPSLYRRCTVRIRSAGIRAPPKVRWAAPSNRRPAPCKARSGG